MGSIDTAVDFLLEVTETDRRFPMGFVRIGGKMYAARKMHHHRFLVKQFGLTSKFVGIVLDLFAKGRAIVLCDGIDCYVRVEHSPNLNQDEMWLGLRLHLSDNPKFVKDKAYAVVSPIAVAEELADRFDNGLTEIERNFLEEYSPKTLALYDKEAKEWAA